MNATTTQHVVLAVNFGGCLSSDALLSHQFN